MAVVLIASSFNCTQFTKFLIFSILPICRWCKLNMDDFDSMSEFSPFTWQPVYSDGSGGELMDFNAAIEDQSHLSSSRGMLETIVEETSDDEENGIYSGKWSGSDSFSSGSSETGSVVRVDVANGEIASVRIDFINDTYPISFRSRQPGHNLGARLHLPAKATQAGSGAGKARLHTDVVTVQSAAEPSRSGRQQSLRQLLHEAE